MSNLISRSTNCNMQFYDSDKYDNICDTILYYNKLLIQNYQNELNEILDDLDKIIDDKFIKLQNSKEKKRNKLNRVVRNILIKEYKDSNTNKYNYE